MGAADRKKGGASDAFLGSSGGDGGGGGGGGGMGEQQGTSVLVWGRSGTGKNRIAEAVGFEVGKPLKLVNFASLYREAQSGGGGGGGSSGSGSGGMGNGIGGKNNSSTAATARAIFDDARLMQAALVLDRFDVRPFLLERDVLEPAAADLMYEIERFPGLVLLLVTAEVDLGDALHKLHPSFVQCLKFTVQVPMPGRRERAQLWRRSLPSRCPVAVSTKEFADLGSRFGSLSGGAINRAAFRAAAAVALLQPKPGEEGAETEEEKEGAVVAGSQGRKEKNPRSSKATTSAANTNTRCVTFADLEKAAEQESRKGEGEAARIHATQFL